ncbi:OprD family porin [Pseudomonas sp. Fl4BN1]|uniref:OprD family porin n=1 Tax=Pseudomonas sp. Fl4BN1 TaxID=2697651 RepID=UPI001376EAB9|nr:OprD family porin [Pseudomonas sp. Fl4BN1]NBF13265.1 outer membrane porin, OprD family [Pseudomonas sp. Fl4BN1]
MKRLFCTLLGLGCLPLLEHARAAPEGVIEDSHASLALRNFYFNQDNRDGDSGQTEEWGQGLRLDYQSGFTQGTLGVGVDAIGLLGVRLDSGGRAGKSGQSRTPSALFPLEHNGTPRSEYSSLGLTGKLRLAKSEARWGTLIPRLPVIKANDGRLLPQTFEGAQLIVKDIDDLTLIAGQLQQAKGRSQTHRSNLSINGANRSRPASATVSAAPTRDSNAFNFAGLDYNVSKTLQVQYYYGQLEQFYQQHFLGLNHNLELPAGSLKTDLRYFHTASSGDNASAAGRTRGYTASGYYGADNGVTGSTRGEVDNRTWSAMLTYSLGGHSFGSGYQQLNGRSNFVQPNQGDGSDHYLITDRQLNSFTRAGEQTWLAQYSLDFAPYGLPGLSTTLVYLKGRDIRSSRGALEEWERDFTLAYMLQVGPLKGLGITWRNASLRTQAGNDTDQNRVFLNYSLALF